MPSMPFFRGLHPRPDHKRPRNDQAPFFNDPDGVSRTAFLLTCALFACGLLFGGGEGGFGDVVAQCLSLPLIVLAAAQWSIRRPRPADWLAIALITGVVALAVVQLMPLPLTTWAALPGRAELLAQMRQADVTPAWTSLSLNPLATERALEWTLPAIATFLAVRWMSPRQRNVMVMLLFVGAIAMTVMDVMFRTADANADVTGASLLAKAYQNAEGIAATARAAPPADSAMTGLFSNHNHFGTFLAMTLPLMVAVALRLWVDRKRSHKTRTAATLTLLGLAAASLLAAAFETHSRAALLLGGLSLLGSIGLLAGLGLEKRVLWTIAGGAVGILVVAGVTAGSVAFDRLGNGIDNDLRWQIHATTLDAARHFGPMGSGLGTFVQAYQAVPPEEGMLAAYVNRAHGDYHELWLETGVPGAILIVVFFVWLGWCAWRVWITPRADRDPNAAPESGRLLPRAASLSIALLLLHSYVEYPLHKTAILAVFGLCCALLAGAGDRLQRPRDALQTDARRVTSDPSSAIMQS